MRIGVLGNCQARGLAHSIARLRPDATLVTLTPHDAGVQEPGYAENQLAAFETCDHLFYQSSLGAQFMGVDLAAFAVRHPQAMTFPTIVSTGQLPDCHFLMREGGGALVGRLGFCHSAIIAGAWLEGLPESRVPALFNRFIYSHMGYLDPAPEPLAQEAARHGYDYSAFLSGSAGRFMHTHHHPAINLLFETARQALAKAGLDSDPAATLPEDALRKVVVWAAYPGLGGAPMAGPPEEIVFMTGGTQRIGLRDFIRASYEVYAGAGVRFHSPLSSRMRDIITAHVIRAA